MAHPVLPTPSNFLAVALVINRSRDGPRFVFHYPPHVTATRHNRSSDHDGSLGDGIGEVDDEGDLFLERASRLPSMDNGTTNADDAGRSVGRSGSQSSQWHQDEHIFTESGSQLVPWESVAGFPTKDLESILTPARAYHKRLFQISLDPLHCVSYPIYAPESGKWKKRRKVAVKDDGDHETDGAVTDGNASAAAISDAEHIETKDMARDAVTIAPSLKADEPEERPSSMTMFNLVFILNPNKNEVNELVNSMFTHIIKKTNKAFKYVQQRSDFVWKESKRILALKDKAREDRRSMSSLWSEILATSSLAASMHDIYEAVSQNKIATLTLDGVDGPAVAHSVQIPMPFHTADLPQEGEANLRGLWLTTANSFLDDDTIEDPALLDKTFALLLLEDEKKILSELKDQYTEPAAPLDPSAANPTNESDTVTVSAAAATMLEFVHHAKPTLSFHQVSQSSSRVLSPTQVRKYAQHFIFWRRAMAIPPLHARDMYVLSPNADTSRLPEASRDWSRAFPMAPDLPKFLGDLSAAPRPYKAFCLHKVHRPLYLEMLAWLMRGGWVTQLCTFAYVVVWPEIIYEVDYAIEAEEIAREKRGQGGNKSRSRSGGSGKEQTVTGPDSGQRDESSGLRRKSDATDDDGDSNTSVSESPTEERRRRFSSTSRPKSANVNDPSASSLNSAIEDTDFADLPAAPVHAPNPAEAAAEQARLDRIAAMDERRLAERATAHARKVPPLATRHPSVNHAPHLAHLTPYVIVDARKATGRESQFLEAIGRRLRKQTAAEDNAGKEMGGKSPQATSRAGTGLGVAGRSQTAIDDRGTTRPEEAARKRSMSGIGPGAVEWDERVAQAWPNFCKYFNGRSALERIALQEDIKRKEAWNLLTAMSEYLLCVRHW
jgi:nitrogen permease regulator 3-like protein